MSESVVLALISAASALLGVIVGSGFPWLREIWSERKHAHYLAIRVVCILDKFVEDCVDVVNDDGLCEGQRNSHDCLEPQVDLPESPAFPADVDWRSIKHDMMYRVLSLPSEVESIDRAIRHLREFLYYSDEFFEERQYQYACLGLTAAKLARDLRNTYSIPDRDFGHWDWDPVKELRDKKDGIEKQREARKSQPSIFDEIMTPNSSDQDELKNL